MLQSVTKRDGTVVQFNRVFIMNAIGRANKDVLPEEEMSPNDIVYVTDQVCKTLEKSDKADAITVEAIQDVVEETLIRLNYAKTAKAYIIYREEHAKLRKAEVDLMEIYEKITNADSKDADIKRENANIDGNSAMGVMLKYGSEGAKHFTLNHVLPQEMADAHNNGSIHRFDVAA